MPLSGVQIQDQCSGPNGEIDQIFHLQLVLKIKKIGMSKYKRFLLTLILGHDHENLTVLKFFLDLGQTIPSH